jgi:hypothetical protein
MVRAFFAAVVTLALGGIAKAETYNIQVWPDDLDKVPCEAWKKNPDGSLTQTGTIVVGNSHSVITGNTFTDAATIRVVEKKCGAELVVGTYVQVDQKSGRQREVAAEISGVEN